MTGLAADLVLVIHLGFVVFVVLGGLLVLKLRWCAWIHLPAAFWGALVELAGWPCPLTPLEKWLRASAEQEVYSGSFVQHYLYQVLYPHNLTRFDQFVLAAIVVIVNLAVYGYVLYRLR